MMRIAIGLLAFGLLTAAIAAGQAALDLGKLELGKKEETGSCAPCHSLRLIHSQRLARAAWVKELDKMAGWGAAMKDRDALLEYLVANYGNDKPLPVPDVSADGSGK